MFVIKYDKLSMIKLVRSIEKYPAIYNNKRHFCKEDQDNAWDRVALEVGEKDSLCRDRWHSIKSCYIRHLKYTALNSKRRPYYLAEYMDFLRPFVSDRIKDFVKLRRGREALLPAYLKEGLPNLSDSDNVSMPPNVLIYPDTVIKSEIVDIEEVSESDWCSIESDQPSTSKSASRSLEQDSRNNINNHKISEPSAAANDSDASFFKGLLPEIARMSNHQKLKFKQEALSIIEDILYAAEEIDVTE